MKTTTAQPTIQALQTVALTSLLSLAFLSPTAAADFSGNLKGVTITDAQASNKAPIATFTYSQNGDIVTFDASGSSDSDGSIGKYKWDFGDGTFGEGATTTYTLTDATKLQVTLTVVDNSNGAALTQQIITPETKGIADDFSINSLSEYTIFSGGLNIHDGAAHTNGAWTTTYAIHNKELASSDHGVEADVYTDGANGTGGLLFRINKIEKTGYMVSFANGTMALSSYNSGNKKWLASFNGKYAAGTYHLRADISGNDIKIYVNKNLALQSTRTEYTTGNSVGVYIQSYGKDNLITIDNFAGK